MDVRPGGRERLEGRHASGMVTAFDAIYFDVIPDERLIYSYEMRLDGRKISVSLATLDLRARSEGRAADADASRAPFSTATTTPAAASRARPGCSMQVEKSLSDSLRISGVGALRP